jgi:hypothetical protein
MSQTLASDFIQNGFDAVSKQLQTPQKLSPELIQDILFGCQIGWSALEKHCQLLHESVDRGMERKSLVIFVCNLLSACDRAVETFNAAKQRVAASDRSQDDTPPSILTLDELIQRSSEMRTKLAGLGRWLETPRPMVALSTLPEESDNPDRKGYIDLMDLKNKMLSRLD